MGSEVNVEGGDCDLILAVTAPLIPTTSLGKAPDLSVVQDEIAEALRRAFNRSRNRLPPDPAQPKPPKDEKPQKPPSRRPIDRPDRWRRDSPRKPRLPASSRPICWCCRRSMTRSMRPRRAGVMPNGSPSRSDVLCRPGAFICEALLSLPSRWRCDAAGRRPFDGTHETAELVENAGKHARHLRLVRFDRIVDERAAPPEFYDTEGNFADPPIRVRSSVG